MFQREIIPEKLSGYRLDKASAILFEEYSRTQIKKWILNGNILLNGEILRPRDFVFQGDELEINPISKNQVSWNPQKINFNTIEEQEDFIIVDKHPMLVMHPGSGCYDGTLANGLLHKFDELKKLPRAGIVHRLDKNTSGVLVVARTEKFRQHFIHQMQNRLIRKKYLAFVAGSPSLGAFTIDKPIGRDSFNRTKMIVRPDGREAVSNVVVYKKYGNYSLLDIHIETGRTHQIRVHLSNEALPIIGDEVYNPRAEIRKNTPTGLIDIIRNFPRQALHADSISFEGLDRKNYKFKAKLPDDMNDLHDKLKFFFD